MNPIVYIIGQIALFLFGFAIGKGERKTPCGKKSCCSMTATENRAYRNFLSYDGTVQED